jgi:hypothetical protein
MLEANQIILIGLVASALTFALRILATYGKINLNRVTVNILLYVVSGALAVVWTSPELPPFAGDVAGWIAAVFALAAPVVGLATLVYNLLYEKVVAPVWGKFSKG